MPQSFPFYWVGLAVAAVLLVAFVARAIAPPTRPRYVRHDSLMSSTELSFFRVLAQIANANYLISMKVRVADIITPAAMTNRKAWWAAFAKVSSKHIDFCLLDPATAAVVLAIEIDDRSHDRPDRRDRDNFLDRAFSEAGVPLLRIRARGRGGYQRQDVQRAITEALAGTA